MKREATRSKHKAKHRRFLRAVMLPNQCKVHGGPVDADNLELLDALHEDPVVKEVLNS